MKPIFEKWENWGTIISQPENSANKLEKGDQIHFRNNVKLEPVDEENGVFTINEMQIAYYIRPTIKSGTFADLGLKVNYID